jgi:hypothetical protein
LYEAQAKSRGELYEHPELNALVRGIGRRLAPPSTDPYLDYRFYILRTPDRAAFSLPDGQVYVSLGMVAALENETQLATLLAHEIEHAASHHALRHQRNSKRRRRAGMTVGALFIGALVVATQGELELGFSGPAPPAGTEDVVPQKAFLGYRADRESEADRRAIRRVARMGYDIGESSRLFVVLGQAAATSDSAATKWTRSSELLERGSRARRQALELGVSADPVAALEVGVETYEALRRRAGLDTAHEFVRVGYPARAVDLAERLVEERDLDPEAHFALAEAYLGGAEEEPSALRYARREYSQTLDLDPDFAEAHRGLGFAALHAGQRYEAHLEFEAYLESRPLAADKDLILYHLETNAIEAEFEGAPIEGLTPQPDVPLTAAPTFALEAPGTATLIGGASWLPEPGLMTGSIGISLRARPPVKIGPSLRAQQVFFVKLDEVDTTDLASAGAFRAADLIPSDLSASGQAYLLNAEPGRYVAVAVSFGSREGSRTSVTETIGTVPVTFTAVGRPVENSAVLSMAAISDTEVTVGPQQMAFMGEYVLSTSPRMKTVDEAQAHYWQQLQPQLAGRGVLARMHSGQAIFKADLKTAEKDPATERKFWAETLEKAFKDAPRWRARAQRQLSELSRLAQK